MTRRVWGIGTARTLRPHWMLRELDLPYETREILTRSEAMQDPEFRALNQREKIPVYQEDDFAMGESAAIVFHLADRHRDRVALAPERATRERARFDDLSFFAMTELDAALYVIRRHEGLPSIYGASPAACRAAREYFLRQVQEIVRQLADGRPYLMGDDFSALDILVLSCLEWAAVVEIALPDELSPYRERLRGRPAFASAMQCNFTPAAVAALAASR
ncbi:MAG: glutathione S-transferase family protein [Myxococcota bacterium]